MGRISRRSTTFIKLQATMSSTIGQHRGIAVHVRRGVALDGEVDAGTFRLGPHDRDDLVEQARHPNRLELEIFRPRELEESLHDLIEPLDLVGDHVDVFDRLAFIKGRRRHSDGSSFDRLRTSVTHRSW